MLWVANNLSRSYLTVPSPFLTIQKLAILLKTFAALLCNQNTSYP